MHLSGDLLDRPAASRRVENLRLPLGQRGFSGTDRRGREIRVEVAASGVDGAHPGRELRRGGGLADEPGHSGGERLLELTGTPVAGDDEHRGACTGGLLPQPPCGLHPVDPAELQVHDHHVGGVPGIPPVQ